MISEDIVKALTRVETKVEAIEHTLSELKSDLKTSKPPVLPVTGGVVGLAAAVWTGYLQATGHA
jgi:hypothetical protein